MVTCISKLYAHNDDDDYDVILHIFFPRSDIISYRIEYFEGFPYDINGVYPFISLHETHGMTLTEMLTTVQCVVGSVHADKGKTNEPSSFEQITLFSSVQGKGGGGGIVGVGIH